MAASYTAIVQTLSDLGGYCCCRSAGMEGKDDYNGNYTDALSSQHEQLEVRQSKSSAKEEKESELEKGQEMYLEEVERNMRSAVVCIQTANAVVNQRRKTMEMVSSIYDKRTHIVVEVAEVPSSTSNQEC